jgi:hypothetical protein
LAVSTLRLVVLSAKSLLLIDKEKTREHVFSQNR